MSFLCDKCGGDAVFAFSLQVVMNGALLCCCAAKHLSLLTIHCRIPEWMNFSYIANLKGKKLIQVHRCNWHSSNLLKILPFISECFGSLTRNLLWYEKKISSTGCELVAIATHINFFFFLSYWRENFQILRVRFFYNFEVFEVIKLYKTVPRQL